MLPSWSGLHEARLPKPPEEAGLRRVPLAERLDAYSCVWAAAVQPRELLKVLEEPDGLVTVLRPPHRDQDIDRVPGLIFTLRHAVEIPPAALSLFALTAALLAGCLRGLAASARVGVLFGSGQELRDRPRVRDVAGAEGLASLTKSAQQLGLAGGRIPRGESYEEFGFVGIG